jgi:hypothetical protein
MDPERPPSEDSKSNPSSSDSDDTDSTVRNGRAQIGEPGYEEFSEAAARVAQENLERARAELHAADPPSDQGNGQLNRDTPEGWRPGHLLFNQPHFRYNRDDHERQILPSEQLTERRRASHDDPPAWTQEELEDLDGLRAQNTPGGLPQPPARSSPVDVPNMRRAFATGIRDAPPGYDSHELRSFDRWAEAQADYARTTDGYFGHAPNQLPGNGDYATTYERGMFFRPPTRNGIHPTGHRHDYPLGTHHALNTNLDGSPPSPVSSQYSPPLGYENHREMQPLNGSIRRHWPPLGHPSLFNPVPNGADRSMWPRTMFRAAQLMVSEPPQRPSSGQYTDNTRHYLSPGGTQHPSGGVSPSQLAEELERTSSDELLARPRVLRSPRYGGNSTRSHRGRPRRHTDRENYFGIQPNDHLINEPINPMHDFDYELSRMDREQRARDRDSDEEMVNGVPADFPPDEGVQPGNAQNNVNGNTNSTHQPLPFPQHGTANNFANPSSAPNGGGSAHTNGLVNGTNHTQPASAPFTSGPYNPNLTLNAQLANGGTATGR